MTLLEQETETEEITSSDEYSHERVYQLLEEASDCLPKVWSIQNFIACNPLIGLESYDFFSALSLRNKYANVHLPKSFDLVFANVIKWCSAYFDKEQSALSLPEKEKGLYLCWKQHGIYDRKFIKNKKQRALFFKKLPSDATEAISYILNRLQVPDKTAQDFIRILLLQLPGWAGYIKSKEEKQQGKKVVYSLTDFVALILASVFAIEDHVLFSEGFSLENETIELDDTYKTLIKNEKKSANHLLRKLSMHARLSDKKESYKAQLAFCIDVRSEPVRYLLEKIGPYQTFGYAGFFGIPASIQKLGEKKELDSFPALIESKHKICEKPTGVSQKDFQKFKKGSSFIHSFKDVFKSLKYNFASPFALVETSGLWFGLFMFLKTAMPGLSFKLMKSLKKQLLPPLETEPVIHCKHPEMGIPFEDQVSYGKAALQTIGLTDNFSKIIAFVGHGSQTQNNVFASALDCGACGGNQGGSSAKILAKILNQESVRKALAVDGIRIPEGSVFIAAQHNTTTDAFKFYEKNLTSDQTMALDDLKKDLEEVALQNNLLRAKKMGLTPNRKKIKKLITTKSQDWSEILPEWGLANNSSFIIAPRECTKDIFLEGRSFLHSYNPVQDEDGKILESIITAPMIVTHWISSQYLFSTLDNSSFGSGCKTTHNLSGKEMVMQGNASDLFTGLPIQSIFKAHGKHYHTPQRLQVIIYSKTNLLDKIISNNQKLQDLFFNRWVLLYVVDFETNKKYLLSENKVWEEVHLS